jgi:sortase B
MLKKCRYNYIDKTAKRIFAVLLALFVLTGCGKAAPGQDSEPESGGRNESAADSHVDFQKLTKENSDIFAWVYVPDTGIDYPVCQSLEGDDSFYKTHNSLKQEDPKGAIYTESANLKNMCDFNEVLHGSSPDDGTMFADLQKFLDRAYFEDHEYIYVYTDGNALIYYIFAAFARDDTRLLEYYDFTVASGCQAFLDEIYENRSMNKLVRSGWEGAVEPENFIITLSTQSTDDPSKQTVVVGCLVGDVRGEIDRVVDYSEPDEEQ